MQDAGVSATTDNRWIGGIPGTVLHEGVDQLGFQLVLITAPSCPLHGPAVRLGADLASLRHHLHFRRALIQAQVMEQVLQGHELARRVRAGAHLAANGLDPLHHPSIERRVFAQGVIHPAATFNHARQDVVDVGNREGIVQTILFNGTVLAHQKAVPQLLLRIAFLAEQHRLTMLAPGNQCQYRFGLAKTGQIVEIAVLAERMQYVPVTHPLRRGRENGDAVRRHPLHQFAAALGKFFHRNH